MKRYTIAKIIMTPFLPLVLIGYFAGMIWAIIHSGWLWHECDSAGKTPEEMYGKKEQKS